MPDITMCLFKKCPKSKGCYRFTAKTDGLGQSYFLRDKNFDWKTCDNFLSNGKFKGEMSRLDTLKEKR